MFAFSGHLELVCYFGAQFPDYRPYWAADHALFVIFCILQGIKADWQLRTRRLKLYIGNVGVEYKKKYNQIQLTTCILTQQIVVKVYKLHFSDAFEIENKMKWKGRVGAAIWCNYFSYNDSIKAKCCKYKEATCVCIHSNS